MTRSHLHTLTAQPISDDGSIGFADGRYALEATRGSLVEVFTAMAELIEACPVSKEDFGEDVTPAWDLTLSYDDPE